MNNIAALFFFLAIFLGPKHVLSLESPRERAIIMDLHAIKALENLDEATLTSFAQEIIAKKLASKSLKIRIERYCARGLLPALAVARAITMEEKSQFKKNNFKEVMHQNGDFVRTIQILNMDSENEEKVLKAYAHCIHPLKNKPGRQFLAPRIGEPVDGYSHTRHRPKPFAWRSKPSRDLDENTRAYSILMEESQMVAEEEQLNDMEKVIMAKCISEQALRFYRPVEHPCDAVKQSLQLYTRSPERAFFDEQGVCNNFCAITFNIAKILGVGDNLRLAHRHFHSYLELKVGEHWYHTHPFGSVGESDFIRIGSVLRNKPIS